jgi:glycosyltransferase involved in cell wall biosynthesis
VAEAMTRDAEPFVTVIIPTYNRSGPLEACLLTLAVQTYPEGRWDVIVVDDGSSDQTSDIVRRHVATMPLRCLRHAKRQGSGPARNTGTAQARGDLVVFLDSDTLAPPWLLAEHARSHAGRRCFVDGPAITVRGDWGIGPPPFDTPWVRLLAALDLAGAEFVTANVSCRRDDLAAAGGFDIAFGTRYGWEDTELGLRLRRLGLDRVKNRRAYVLHRQISGYDWRDRGRKQEQAGVNAAYFLSKHPTRDVARLVRGRPTVARVFSACGLDADRLGRACARSAFRSPLAWALGQIYEIQQYQRGIRRGHALQEPGEASRGSA